jgi:hypothetical protein
MSADEAGWSRTNAVRRQTKGDEMETVANCAQHGELAWPAAVVLIAMVAAVVAVVWAIVYGVTKS